MQQILRGTKESRFVTGAELVSAATANTTAMRAEFLLRRKQTIGPVEFYFVQPKLTLFWLRGNFKRLKAKIDGRGSDVPLAGKSTFCIIPAGVESRGSCECGACLTLSLSSR